MGRQIFLILFVCAGVADAMLTGSGWSKGCALPWNSYANGTQIVDAVCPFGERLPGDVTFPKNATWVDKVCVVYGYLPYVAVLAAVLDAIFRAIRRKGLGTREMVFLMFVGMQVLLGELVFKKIASEPRPTHSCNFTCGMPSSHSTMSIGFFMLMFLDAAYRVMPSFPIDIPTARLHSKSIQNTGETYCGWTIRDFCLTWVRAGFNIIPLADAHTLTPFDFLTFATFWGIILLPVAFTRTVLFDHSPKQVIVGGVIGFVEAAVWQAVVRRLMFGYNHLVGQRIGGIFIHNFALPVNEAMSTAWILLAEVDEYYEDDDAETALFRSYNELTWYLDQLNPCCEQFEFDEDKPRVKNQRDAISGLQKQIGEKAVARNPRALTKLLQSDREIDDDANTAVLE